MRCVEKGVPDSPGGPASLELDACTRCQMFWFDPGEFEGMPPSIPEQVNEPEVATKDLPEAARMALMHARMEVIKEQANLGEASPDNLVEFLSGALLIPYEIDEEAPGKVDIPWVTAGLVGLIVAVGLGLGFFRDTSSASAGLTFMPSDPWRAGGLTLLTAFTVHGGWAHLLSNLYFLATFGDNVEDMLGKTRFVLFWLAATLGSFAMTFFLPGETATHFVGAGGGVSGVIILYILFFPRAKLGFLFFWKWTVRFPAWLMGLGWVLFHLLGFFVEGRVTRGELSTVTQSIAEIQATSPAVGFAGPVVGAVFGLAAYFLWRDRLR